MAPISLGTIGWLWILDSTYSVINWTFQALGFIDAGGAAIAVFLFPLLVAAAIGFLRVARRTEVT